MKNIKVLVLTTSFPMHDGSVSGLFVKRLVDSFPSSIQPFVLAPCSTSSAISNDQFDYRISCFKYAPKNLQILAHQSGGIPAALESNKFALLLLPLFIISMFVKCLIEAKNVDLIHANWTICGVIGGIVGKIYSKPTITTIRGEDGNKAEKSIIFRALLKTSIFLSSYVVGVSASLVKKAELISKSENSKIVYVPNGIDYGLIDFKNKFKSEKFEELILTTVGNLTRNKNIEQVINAVRIVNSEGRDVKLNIIGDGPQKERLAKLIDEYGLTNSVHLTGNLDPNRVYELIINSSIFILSSFREGRPNVILEAMALGTPIIASNIEGVCELISDGYSGLLYNPYKNEELVSCINRLGADRKLQRYLCDNATNYIIENKLFWNETAKKYVDIYTSALQNYNS